MWRNYSNVIILKIIIHACIIYNLPYSNYSNATRNHVIIVRMKACYQARVHVFYPNTCWQERFNINMLGKNSTTQHVGSMDAFQSSILEYNQRIHVIKTWVKTISTCYNKDVLFNKAGYHLSRQSYILVIIIGCLR